MNNPLERLTLHQLRVFQTVARNLHFSKAAEELSLTQPAVSMHVKQLEDILGVSLFEKRGRRIALTEAGQHLFEVTCRLTALLQEAVSTMDEFRGMQRGTLRVAADTTAGVYVVPEFLGEFHRKFPAISVALDVSNRSLVARKLLLNEVDLAVMGQVPDQESLVAEPFMVNELVVIAAPGNPLSKKDTIDPADLTKEHFLMREVGSGTRAAAERFFISSGVTPKIAMELGSNNAIKEAAAAGLGIAIIPKRSITLELSANRLVTLPVKGFPLIRHWHVVHIKDRRLSPPAARFKEMLLKQGMRSGSGQ